MCPQDLCPEPSHSTQPSLFSAFLHCIPYSCVLQLACPQPFLLHFPLTSHSHPKEAKRPLLLFSTSSFFPQLPYMVTSSVPSDQHTSPAHSCQELSAAHCAQDTTQHDLFPVCSGSSKPNEEDDSICIICCHCPEMFHYSVVGRLSYSIA